MSEQRGDGVIDEALSSVLRLVAEDLRVPGRLPGDTLPAARLLLTESQRIPGDGTGPPLTAPESPSSGPVPEGDLPLALPALPDDATLRDLIRDVLREELRGPMGEHITRTVRKLVLSEVHRALATRDLDGPSD